MSADTRRTHGARQRDIELDSDEVELLRLIAEGENVETIAPVLHLSTRTVRRRIRALCCRTGFDTPIQVVVAAIRWGKL